jgi:hypothetical protein
MTSEEPAEERHTRIGDPVEQLIAEHGYWDEHPEYGLEDWEYDVVNGHTRLGYWPWVTSKLDEQEEEESEDSEDAEEQLD